MVRSIRITEWYDWISTSGVVNGESNYYIAEKDWKDGNIQDRIVNLFFYI